MFEVAWRLSEVLPMRSPYGHAFVPTRLTATQSCTQSHVQVAAAHSLAQLCQSNHANQEAVADEGGVEAIVESLRYSNSNYS